LLYRAANSISFGVEDAETDQTSYWQIIIMSSDPWIRTAILAGATVVTAALVSFVVAKQQQSKKSDTYVGQRRGDCWLCGV
jgi:hypothetical protein